VLQKSPNDTIRSSGRVELVSSPPDALFPHARRSTSPPSLDLRPANTAEEQSPAAGKGVSILLAVGFLLSLKAKDPRVLFVDVS
jgi:hypothetical protein